MEGSLLSHPARSNRLPPSPTPTPTSTLGIA